MLNLSGKADIALPGRENSKCREGLGRKAPQAGNSQEKLAETAMQQEHWGDLLREGEVFKGQILTKIKCYRA